MNWENHLRKCIDVFLVEPTPEHIENATRMMNSYMADWVKGRITDDEKERLRATLQSLSD